MRRNANLTTGLRKCFTVDSDSVPGEAFSFIMITNRPNVNRPVWASAGNPGWIPEKHLERTRSICYNNPVAAGFFCGAGACGEKRLHGKNAGTVSTKDKTGHATGDFPIKIETNLATSPANRHGASSRHETKNGFAPAPHTGKRVDNGAPESQSHDHTQMTRRCRDL